MYFVSISKGADPNLIIKNEEEGGKDVSVLYNVVEAYPDHPDDAVSIADLLVNAGADVNWRGDLPRSILEMALRLSKIEHVKILLAAPDFNKDSFDWSRVKNNLWMNHFRLVSILHEAELLSDLSLESKIQLVGNLLRAGLFQQMRDGQEGDFLFNVYESLTERTAGYQSFKPSTAEDAISDALDTVVPEESYEYNAHWCCRACFQVESWCDGCENSYHDDLEAAKEAYTLIAGDIISQVSF